MLKELLRVVPVDAVNMALVLALSFFMGLEREEHKQTLPLYTFGGVRTFPLIGLVSYALALIATPDLLPWLVGLAIVGGFMFLSYHHKLAGAAPAGLTTEVSALTAYVIGGLVERQHYWIATAIGVLSVLVLELKKGLEGLTKHVASNEIITVAKFLVLSVVILPIVPARELTRFHIDPFKTWMVVVAVSGVSFASYVVQRLLAARGGVMLSAILGGAYSSTMTTVVLARQAKEERRPNLFAGSILTASAVMYLRLVLLLVFFNRTLAGALAPAFCTLSLLGALTGWVVARQGDDSAVPPEGERKAKNPLELKAAVLFALVFVTALVLTQLAHDYLGRAGLYSLAAVMGIADVDPFILGVAQTGPTATPIRVAAAAITIAAASNNVAKALYAYAFADRETGRRSLALLMAFAALGVLPLAWM
jgi:uncharacterized membrane protein (DUF4010 family)